LIATALAYLTVRAGTRRQVRFLRAMRAAPPYRWHHIVLVVIGAFVLAFALDLLAAVLHWPIVSEKLRVLSDTRPEWAVFTLWAGLGAALEELLYRGFLLPPAQRYFGAAGGIVAVSLGFGAAHVLTYWNEVPLVGIAFVMGLYLTLARHLTGSTMPGIAAHMLINLFAASQLYPA
jgi:membrane protease YdiL (CAAX protease family)